MGQRKVNNGSPIERTPPELIALNHAALPVVPRVPELECNRFNPKVAGSIPARPINREVVTPRPHG
jgi:hypothetical protein